MGVIKWSRKNAAALVSALGGESVKALLEYCEEHAGDAASKAVAGGVIGAAAGPLGMIGGVAAGLIASIGANLISDGLVRDREKRDAHLKFLTNEHVARLQALAVEETLLAFAKECKRTKSRERWAERIEEVAGQAETWWLNAVNDPNTRDIEPFLETAVVGELTLHLTRAQQQPIAVGLWKSLLASENIGLGRRNELPELALDAAAAYLGEHYTEQWKNTLKHDFATDGHAYAAVSLHFFAEILAGVQQNSTDLKEVNGGVEEVKRMVGELNLAATALQTVSDLSTDLRNTVKDAKALLTTVSKQLAEIKELLTVQTQVITTHTSAEVDRAIAAIADPKHVRDMLRRTAVEKYEARLKEIDAITDWQERERLRSAEVQLMASRMAHVDLLITDIIKADEGGGLSPIGHEMNRILNEQGTDAALAYLRHCDQGLMQDARLLKRTRELADELFLRELRRTLQPKLNAARLLEIRGDLDGACDQYGEIHELEPTWMEMRKAYFWALVLKADDLELHGTVPQRHKKLELAHELAKESNAMRPDDPHAQRDLSISYDRLGYLLRQEGKVGEARNAYEEGLAIRRKLADKDPQNAQIQRDLSYSYERLGDLLLREGTLAQARKALEEDLRISKTLADKDPTNTQAQRDLSISLNKLGDLLVSEGKLPEARRVLEEDLRISKVLAEKDPNNALAQRDLSISFNKLGDLLMREGELPQAHTAFETGLRIRKTLAEKDPTSTQTQRDLSYSYERLGDLLMREGELSRARENFDYSLRIRMNLAERDSKNVQAQRDLAISFNNLGDLLMNEEELPQARKAYEDGLRIIKTLAEMEPTNAQTQRDLSISFIKLGALLLREGELPRARKAFEDSLRISKDLAEKDTNNALVQRDLSISFDLLGALLVQQSELPQARRAFEEGIRIRETLTDRDPTNSLVRRDLLVSYYNLGSLLVSEGELPQARKALENGLYISKVLAEKYPTNVQAQSDLSYGYFQLSNILAEQGELDEAWSMAEASLKVDDRLSALDPNNVVWREGLYARRAWLEKLKGGL
jgi:tetratricopeptide (TPR) repeat protein